MKQKKNRPMRQGDVLVIPINSAIPADATERKADRGRVVLAYGEVTGHAHAIDAADAVSFGESDDAFWLRVDRPTSLTHEEHGTIPLAVGNYRVVRQREYSPEEIRRVAD